MNRVRLLIFNAALGPLDYRVPDGMEVEPGSVVVAPLGPRQIVGIVWEADRLPASEVPEAKLRPLVGVLPVPPLKAELRRLIEWTADYYCASLASVARMVLASGGALRGPATMIEYRLTGGMPERMTPQRQAAIEALEGEQATIRELAGIAGVSEGVLRGMVNQGVLEPVEVDCDRPYPAGSSRNVRRGGEHGQLRPVPARWRHRLGQDRGLFRSHRRSFGEEAPSAGAVA